MYSASRIQLDVIQLKNIFRIHLLGQVRELLLISDVFQREQLMGFQRYISTVAALMIQILRNKNYAISVMVASRKQVTHLVGIDVVQHIA